jgi:integrase
MLNRLTKVSKENEDWFLSDQQVKQLFSFDRGSIDKEPVKVLLDRFIISCFTGCRHSEVETIETVNDKQLKYYSKKTSKYVIVPYPDVIKPYIESGLFRTRLTMTYSPPEATNRALRENIFKKLGWNDEVKVITPKGRKKEFEKKKKWQVVTFHDARKYYGKMLLDNDISLYKVSQLMGHASVKTTEKFYAAVTREKMMEEVNLVINLNN